MKVNVKRARFAEKEKIKKDQRLKMISFAIAIACIACREKWNFGKRRIDKLVRGSYAELTEYYEHYGGNPDEIMTADIIPTLYFGLRNQVKCLDIPIEEIEAKYALSAEFSGWRNEKDREKRKYRYEEELSMERVLRSYWYGMIMHLWHTYGYGGTVLTEFYRRVQEQWKSVMDLYLNCSESGDAGTIYRMEEAIRKIEGLGVKL